MSNNDFDKLLLKVFRVNGHVFPLNRNEISYFEKKNHIILQKKNDLPSPSEILLRGKLKCKLPMDSHEDHDIENSLGMAAREGKEISEDILEQMRKDRERAENGKKNNQ